MRRIVLGITCLLGVCFVMGAVFLGIDASVSSQTRANNQEKIADTIDALAEDRPGRRDRGIRALASSYRSLTEGVFFSSGLSLDAVLPTDVNGWTQRAYTHLDGLAITGEESRRDVLAQGGTQSLLSRFHEDSERRQTGRAVTYENNSYLVSVRLRTDLQAQRELKNGSPQDIRDLIAHPKDHERGMRFMSLDGIYIQTWPQISNDYDANFNIVQNDVDYRRFTFGVGRIIAGEVMTNAPEDRVVEVLKRLDFAAAQETFPRTVAGYTPGRGPEVYWAFETAQSK